MYELTFNTIRLAQLHLQNA